MFSCEVEENSLPVNTQAVDIDIGLYSFTTLSNRKTIKNPKFFRQEEKALDKVQRKYIFHSFGIKYPKLKKGTSERKKCRKVVARIHERILWKRQNFIHQHFHKIVNRFGVLTVEDLNVNRMLHNHCLAKSISDAA